MHTYLCKYVTMYACMYMRMYLHVYVHPYICTYIYIGKGGIKDFSNRGKPKKGEGNYLKRGGYIPAANYA